MATDQNIKSKTLASEIDTAYGKYGTWQVHLFLVYKMYKEAITGEFFCSDRIFYAQLRPHDIQYCIVIHENWKLLVLTLFLLTFSNSSKVFLTVSVIIFSDIIL